MPLRRIVEGNSEKGFLVLQPSSDVGLQTFVFLIVSRFTIRLPQRVHIIDAVALGQGVDEPYPLECWQIQNVPEQALTLVLVFVCPVVDSAVIQCFVLRFFR